MVFLLCLSRAFAAGDYRWVRAELEPTRPQIEVLVVLTTTPHRIWTSLSSALDSIFAQSLVPDRVVLTLPRGPMLRKPSVLYPEDSELPGFLVNPRPGLIVDRDCHDMGPGSHLLNGLKFATLPDSFVVVFADDHTYFYDHLAVLVFNAGLPDNRGAAVGVVGLHSRPEFIPCLGEAEWTEGCVGRVFLGSTFGPITLGWMGTVVRPWFFGPTRRLLSPSDAQWPWKWPDECSYHDDIWLGAMLARRGIRRISINWGLPGLSRELPASKGSEALLKGNRWNLLRCQEALEARWPRLWHRRPRLIGVGPQEHLRAMASCAGELDDWLTLEGYPAEVDVDVDGDWLTAVRRFVAASARHEHNQTVIMAVPGPLADCSWISAALQCAMRKPRFMCRVSGERPLAVATADTWRGGDATRMVKLDSRCWLGGRNATWGRCCRPSSGHDAGKRRQPEGPFTVPRGCSAARASCCKTDSTLIMPWQSFEGKWDVQGDDGNFTRYYISDLGYVSLLGTEPRWRLKETSLPGTSELRPIGARGQRAARHHAGRGGLELWRFAQGTLQTVRLEGHRTPRMGAGTRVVEPFGQVP